jgi:hypothetical protein
MPKVQTQADGTTPTAADQAAAQAPEGAAATVAAAEAAADKEYVAVANGPIIDPYTHIVFTGRPQVSPLTDWLKAQIAGGRIKEQASEPPAE